MKWHDLRHSFASLLIHQGESVKYVQTQMGHSSSKVTLDRYGHLYPEVHQEAAKRLDDTVFGDAKTTKDATDMRHGT